MALTVHTLTELYQSTNAMKAAKCSLNTVLCHKICTGMYVCNVMYVMYVCMHVCTRITTL
jgi:hypothetical protein